MVVPCHGGVVEERGLGWVARGVYEDVLCEGGFEGGAGGDEVEAGEDVGLVFGPGVCVGGGGEEVIDAVVGEVLVVD